MNILILEDCEFRIKDFLNKYNSNDNDVVVTTSSYECIEKLNTNTFDLLFLDHDLGLDDTGYKVARYISTNPNVRPKRIIVHSYNPVGSKNMLDVLELKVNNYNYCPGCWAKDTNIIE